jgi:hypothetical protein
MKESAFLDLARGGNEQFSLRSEPKERTGIVPSPTAWRLRQGNPGQCTDKGG